MLLFSLLMFSLSMMISVAVQRMTGTPVSIQTRRLVVNRVRGGAAGTIRGGRVFCKPVKNAVSLRGLPVLKIVLEQLEVAVAREERVRPCLMRVAKAPHLKGISEVVEAEGVGVISLAEEVLDIECRGKEEVKAFEKLIFALGEIRIVKHSGKVAEVVSRMKREPVHVRIADKARRDKQGGKVNRLDAEEAEILEVYSPLLQ